MRFGEFLENKNLISNPELEGALDVQRVRGGRVGRILRDLDLISQEQLDSNLQEFIETGCDEKAKKILEQIKSSKLGKTFINWARTRDIYCISNEEGSVTLYKRKFDDVAVEFFEENGFSNVSFRVVDSSVIHFLKNSLGSDSGQWKKLSVEQALSSDAEIRKEAPYTKVIKDLLEEAKAIGASDIHIEPKDEGIEIRIRVNGVLEHWKTFSSNHRQNLINEAKKHLGFPIGVTGKTLGARSSFKSWNIDIRGSIVPTNYGDSIVGRILDKDSSFDINQLGFDIETLSDLLSITKEKNGVAILSGPTGSGKTKTLFSLLQCFDLSGQKIITVEDPIEYSFDSFTQIPVKEGRVSFHNALREILRHDPDVILIGEIRDEETADICFKAAATGHIVISTLHANDPVSVVQRLMNLGISREMIRDNLRFSGAQRLVRTLCQNCAVSVGPSHLKEIQKHSYELGKFEEARVRDSIGCGDGGCRSGVTGRKAILSYLKEAELRNLLEKDLDRGSIEAPMLRSRAVDLAASGEICIWEALNVA